MVCRLGAPFFSFHSYKQSRKASLRDCWLTNGMLFLVRGSLFCRSGSFRARLLIFKNHFLPFGQLG